MPVPFAGTKGEGVRPPMTGGVEVRDIGGVGFLMAGLSHEEKKSSSGSPAGVLDSAPTPSLIMTSPGYLSRNSQYDEDGSAVSVWSGRTPLRHAQLSSSTPPCTW